jgi:hypothetical protein
VNEAFFAGPLRVRIEASEAPLRDKLAETLGLYDRSWDGPFLDVVLSARSVTAGAEMVDGAFLRCARMTVDAAGGEFHATTRCGARARSSGTAARTWSIEVPEAAVASRRLEELEDIVGLALTAGWRTAGWVPLHAAAVIRDGVCPILCAGSGGGKSTLTAALVRSGWRALGDDKLLLRNEGTTCELRALLHTFNLHPRTSEWFPEVGDLTLLPPYSSWTEKRKFRSDGTWPEASAPRACPTHVVRVRRESGRRGVCVRELPRAEIFPTLLKQIAIPSDRTAAAGILATVAKTVAGVRGLDLEIGDDAYRDPECLAGFERELLQ